MYNTVYTLQTSTTQSGGFRTVPMERYTIHNGRFYLITNSRIPTAFTILSFTHVLLPAGMLVRGRRESPFVIVVWCSLNLPIQSASVDCHTQLTCRAEKHLQKTERFWLKFGNINTFSLYCWVYSMGNTKIQVLK